MSEVKFRKEARENFKKAFKNFDEIGHLKGMYLSKQHEAQLYDEQDSKKQHVLRMILRYRHDYFEHIKEHGSECSCSHIPRHHGEEISLLTEIVTQNKKQDISRKPKKHATNELTGFNNLKQLRSEEQTKRNSGKQNLQANLM